MKLMIMCVATAIALASTGAVAQQNTPATTPDSIATRTVGDAPSRRMDERHGGMDARGSGHMTGHHSMAGHHRRCRTVMYHHRRVRRCR